MKNNVDEIVEYVVTGDTSSLRPDFTTLESFIEAQPFPINSQSSSTIPKSASTFTINELQKNRKSNNKRNISNISIIFCIECK